MEKIVKILKRIIRFERRNGESLNAILLHGW